MGITKPNQQLRRDLKEVAALLKWSGVDIMEIAVKLATEGHEAEARELLLISAKFQEAEDKLEGYAEEVKVGRIVRGNVG
ncbi:hypothetical protein ACIOWK_26780 [Pseudomonas protegens]|uniref:hypothetical protein n=1 Tax=Pseudomonas protegens TaxID=380021 RepID=UPI00380222A4